VPELYGSSRRILEMEYLGDAQSLPRALARMPKRERRRFQLKLAEQLLYTVIYHAFAFREMHGDLHPGNVMVARDGRLNLIDWGNVIDLNGKWGPVWDYLAGAILADTDLLADALIRISTQPEVDAARREEIRAALDETLRKKGVSRLTRSSFIAEVRRGGLDGLHARGQTVLHLMSNTQQVGLVLKRDYLHLSRALFALAGSIGTLYEGEPGRRLAIDLAIVALRLPATFTRETFVRELNAVRGRLARRLARRLASPVQPAVPVPVPRVVLPKPPAMPALVPIPG